MGIALALLFALAPRFAVAQDTYQPMGAPVNPAVPAQWNRYHDYAEATALLEQLARAHPRLCRLESLGESYGGREMWVSIITDLDRGAESEKAGFWIDGGIHANELQGPEVVLYTAWFLLESHGRNPVVARLLAERVFYLLPMLSPDSRDAHMREPNTTHSPRSGQRPIDDDQDGQADEDGPNDLDGDGSISQMRVRDPHGRWRPDREYPNLMREVGAEEVVGEYTLLGTEGIDDDGDGEVNEDGDGFYDPNRDWAWSWQPAYVQGGAYRYPFSIPENRMAADFVMAHANIAGAQSYHNAGGMILRSPGVRGAQVPGPDLGVFDLIGRKGEAMLPGYRYMNVANDLYEVFGGEFDWFYSMQGALTFTNELFTPFNYFRKPSEGFFGKQDDLHLFDRYLLFGEGIRPWKEYDHPQYGKVEIGGFVKQWTRQPPSFLLEEECHRNMAFTLYHADQMPMVEVQSVEAKPLADGLTQVTAVVANRRLIPTRLAVDVQNRITPQDQVVLTGEGLEVVAGLVSDTPWFDRAQEQKRRPHELRIDSIAGLRPVYVRWLVRGNGPYTVTARSTKGGVHSLSR